MASLTQWTWVWASSWSWWWTEKPDVLESMGLQSRTWLTDWTTTTTEHDGIWQNINQVEESEEETSEAGDRHAKKKQSQCYNRKVLEHRRRWRMNGATVRCVRTLNLTHSEARSHWRVLSRSLLTVISYVNKVGLLQIFTKSISSPHNKTCVFIIRKKQQPWV